MESMRQNTRAGRIVMGLALVAWYGLQVIPSGSARITIRFPAKS